jgi:hypothetical protein
MRPTKTEKFFISFFGVQVFKEQTIHAHWRLGMFMRMCISLGQFLNGGHLAYE